MSTACPAALPDRDELAISPMATPEDAAAFRALNEEWILRIFSMEPADLKTIDDPFGSIVDPGGTVLLARERGVAIGCVALVAEGDGVFELAKMAVAPAAQGRGVGRRLVLAAIDHARHLGARALVLESNHRLESAIHLYEQAGFVHVPAVHLTPSPYARADVFMRMQL
jgi:GNAT superfamily N-acetyltransferase